MSTLPVHRLIEQRAAERGDTIAIVDGARSMTYRDMNHAANNLARRLMASGFRRGGHAVTGLPRSIDLAVVLLAILKAGGSYTWNGPEARESGTPRGVSFTVGGSGVEEQWCFVDLSEVLRRPVACSPNLPVLSRPTDIACVLPQNGSGQPDLRLPHATIASLQPSVDLPSAAWTGDSGALDLWMALMGGTTLVVDDAAVAAA